MGLLDDAIREHLELKRRRGADAEEVTRQEQEALGAPQRAEFADVAPAAAPPVEPVEPVEEPLPPLEEEPPPPPAQQAPPGASGITIDEPTVEYTREDAPAPPGD